jgi:hypothetical protein
MPPSRKCLLLQFFPGDQEAAMRVARLIADNEPVFRTDVDFVFCGRFDCIQDAATIQYVSKKFKVIPFKCTRREVGWPTGCNSVWCEAVTNFLLGKHLRGEWPDMKWALTFEADCVPVHPDWINKLDDEWNRAAAEGKCVVGCWMPNGMEAGLGHINGNMMVSPDIGKRFSNLIGCPIGTAWDVYFASTFQPVWWKTGLIANFYRALNVTDAQFRRCYAGSVEAPVLIHGVKDDSAEKYAGRVLRRHP